MEILIYTLVAPYFMWGLGMMILAFKNKLRK